MTESNSQQILFVVETEGLVFGDGVTRNLTINCFGSGANAATCRAGAMVRACGWRLGVGRAIIRG